MPIFCSSEKDLTISLSDMFLILRLLPKYPLSKEISPIWITNSLVEVTAGMILDEETDYSLRENPYL